MLRLSCMLSGILLSPVAVALSLDLTDDAAIDGLKPWKTLGFSGELVVHNWGSRRGLVRFDAAPLSGLHVGRATLTFHLRSASACGDIDIHPVTSIWTEDQVTFATAPSFDDTPIASVSVCPEDVGSIDVDVTSIVRDWADGTAPAHGLLLRTDDGIHAAIDAKERADGHPMRLDAVVGDQHPTVLDFTDPDACVVDEPGMYVLDRNWNVNSPDFCRAENRGAEETKILISASDVVLDLRGYGLIDEPAFLHGEVLKITGSRVTVRNGSIMGGDYSEQQGNAITSSGDQVTLERITANRVSSVGVDGTIRFSTIIGGVRLWERGVLEHSLVDCPIIAVCVSALGRSSNGLIVRFNRIRAGGAPGMWLTGDELVIESNLFERPGTTGILHEGNHGVIARNVFRGTDGPETAIRVTGTGNIVDGNIVNPGFEYGIDLEGAGNYYGSNRVSASNPYVGTSDDTDWGGNVNF